MPALIVEPPSSDAGPCPVKASSRDPYYMAWDKKRHATCNHGGNGAPRTPDPTSFQPCPRFLCTLPQAGKAGQWHLRRRGVVVRGKGSFAMFAQVRRNEGAADQPDHWHLLAPQMLGRDG
ncbi:hypothetical protein J3458_003291 [Metarhizium acridum]|uniref:uncharacterized protein n=1 Tax=Metarhizium acridum TaxID=92637 RepID=UPI001C6CA54E|nr:hypothetical protein J3458_003291 [Metarhizium acridum]